MSHKVTHWDSDTSESLHRKFGFERVAVFSEQGRKFGRYWDVAWYEKPLGVETKLGLDEKA